MIKLKNSVFKLVKNEKININCVKTEDAIKICSNKMNMFVDLREIRKLTNFGRFLVAKHVLRDMLKFWIVIKSQCHKKFLNESFNFIFYYASYWRSAFASLAANNISLLNTPNLIGGYNKWLELNDPIDEAR